MSTRDELRREAMKCPNCGLSCCRPPRCCYGEGCECPTCASTDRTVVPERFRHRGPFCSDPFHDQHPRPQPVSPVAYYGEWGGPDGSLPGPDPVGEAAP